MTYILFNSVVHSDPSASYVSITGINVTDALFNSVEQLHLWTCTCYDTNTIDDLYIFLSAIDLVLNSSKNT